MSWWENTIVISAGVLTLFNLVDKIINASRQAKEPLDDIKRRIDVLEQKDFEKRIEELEKGNRILQKSILALLKHSIDGNNTEGLKKAEEELSDYLTSK